MADGYAAVASALALGPPAHEVGLRRITDMEQGLGRRLFGFELHKMFLQEGLHEFHLVIGGGATQGLSVSVLNSVPPRRMWTTHS
jgi:hypothetical protein